MGEQQEVEAAARKLGLCVWGRPSLFLSGQVVVVVLDTFTPL